MKRGLLVPILFAGVALASGVANANPQYWRENRLLLEVSADPRDGRDLVQVDATRADRLELVALNDAVRLRGLTLHLSDGRSISQRVGTVRPGQPVLVDLPERCGAITSVELDYGDPALRRTDRSPARLQIIPRTAAQARYSSYQPARSTTYAPSYRTTPTYRVQPTRTTLRPRHARSSWTIQGSFRF
jgi:hypothetical protein